MSVGSASQPVRFLALGDSYTVGEDVARSESWPWIAVALLREEGIRVADPEIVATTGWTTGDLARGIAAAEPNGPFQVVTLLIGVNNQYQGLALDRYRHELGELLDRAIALAGGAATRTIVISVPDWGVMPHGEGHDRKAVARQIDAFNEAARELAVDRGAAFVDITDLSRLAAGRPDLVAADGLHPSGPMYRMWIERILPAMRDAIS